MNHFWIRSAIVLVLIPLASCYDAVVGREKDELAPTIETCEELGHKICQRACDCTVGDRCIVGSGTAEMPSSLVYDNLTQCENNFVTFACQNPPNPISYYEDCADTITSCVERIVDGLPEQAAQLPLDCQNPNGFGIACGSSECIRVPLDSPTNEVCCVSIDGDLSTSSCQLPELSCDGPSLGLSFGCDGPEDCGGTACCGTLSSGVACTEQENCSEDTAQYCHTLRDCPTGQICIPVTVAGFELRACAEI